MIYIEPPYLLPEKTAPERASETPLLKTWLEQLPDVFKPQRDFIAKLVDTLPRPTLTLPLTSLTPTLTPTPTPTLTPTPSLTLTLTLTLTRSTPTSWCARSYCG